ncbi:hypothetical protein LUZ63_013793 [Rhynchospora breviuscula]|uniref:DUF3593 domain-containing protein n=1 Tax=Rhynchospora breviuscula TaxID=2022672 RepID=A0A9Q0HKZ9_9POAL|nr:hypothetical protein LUZ63_013793 [Rhynchospora breviuscula]
MLCLHCPWRTAFLPPLLQPKPRNLKREAFLPIHTRGGRSFSIGRIRCGILPVDPWAPTIDSQSIASQLFAVSLFPYLGFLYFLSKSKTAPKLTLFGFYFLLAFVGATIPAGIYAKLHYGTSLSNVDWLHGSAESLLTLTNLFIVLGLRKALRKLKDGSKKTTTDEIDSEIKENSLSR